MKKWLIISISSAIFALPFNANALIPPLLQFGGLAVSLYPCTCNSGAIWLYYTPLYLTGVPVTGPITYYSSVTFQFERRLGGTPGIPYLGAYIPGVQACWIYAGYFCFPLPAYGVQTFIGTGVTWGG